LKQTAERNLIDKSGTEEDNLYLLGLALKGKGQSLAAMSCFRQAAALNGAMRRCIWEIEGKTGE
jgi:hypothetical protein